MLSSIPDDTFPHATGLAAETVQAHSKEEDLVLWASWFCPFVQRVWIALEEKGVPYRYHEVNPYKKEKEFLQVNPLGLVPAIELKGKATLWESLVLLQYLEDAYPSSSNSNVTPLLPEDPIDRAKARIWIDHVSKKIVPAFYTFLQGQTKEEQAGGREKLLAGLEKLVRAMAPLSSGPYFFGPHFSLVDISLIPWVLRFPTVLKKYRNFELPTEDGEGDVWKRFKEWEAAVASRQGVLNTVSDEEKYFGVYKRYADNSTQSEVAQATRAGKPLP
ncbi:hypothetical protein FRC19_008328 [Serendipita sp. 401]|nr:hypothetical protein FRC16_005889 [Serendipita sp. 398]KAG8828212.1 hypothetical protein FRC19_008328 [Serendipita sp. 401]KAG9058707.1 hypothetical protein FS842_003496 [Serendipita sp. 407]